MSSKYAQETIKPYSDEGEKGPQVEAMFDNIAPTYDRLNHLLSFGIDKYWRKAALKRLKAFRPQEVLDMATGTGDFALMALKILNPKHLLGADLSEGMLKVAREKAEKCGARNIDFQKEDCMNLTLADETFDAATVAYGVRNFPDLEKGLKELLRVLKPGGHLVVIELTTPQRFPMKQLFNIYSRYVMPFFGKLLSKDRSAYEYLPATMAAFPQGEVMQEILTNCGYKNVEFKRYTAGLSTLYIAEK